MKTRRRKGRRANRSLTVCAAFLAALLLLFAGPAAAANLTIVKGIVGTVAGNHIFLNGKSVDLSGIPIRNPSGKEVSAGEISPGRKVALYYRRGSLSSVVVYDPMVE